MENKQKTLKKEKKNNEQIIGEPDKGRVGGVEHGMQSAYIKIIKKKGQK